MTLLELLQQEIAILTSLEDAATAEPGVESSALILHGALLEVEMILETLENAGAPCLDAEVGKANVPRGKMHAS